MGILTGFPTAEAADLPRKAPGPRESAKKISECTSADGLTFSWRGPRSYHPEKGTGLTVVLDGSGLTHAWEFANHSKETFRPDDLVVCPDGTSPNGSGGFNFRAFPGVPAWAKEARKLKLSKDSLKDWEALQSTVRQGLQAYASLCNKAASP